MIKFYYSTAPNPMKVALCLEEMGLAYEPVPVDTRKGAQHKPEYLAVNPNAKVPAIVDGDVVMFDSNAIVLYLAEKTGKFTPKDRRGHYDVLQWLMWQMGNIGPMLGQVHHFRGYAPEKLEYAINRYTNEANRLYGVLDRRLNDRPYVAGDYSIADMAIFPWLRSHERQGVKLDEYSNVKRWFDAIAARPAVERGVKVLSEASRAEMDAKAKEVLFGATQYQRR